MRFVSILRYSLLLGVVGSCAWWLRSAVQKPEPALVGVGFLDYNLIMQTLPATKRLKNDLERHLKECQKVLMEKESALRTEYQDVLECIISTPKDYEQARAIEEKRQQFKASLLNVQRDAESMRFLIQKAYNDVMAQIKERLHQILLVLCDEQGYESVMDSKYTIYHREKNDITNVVRVRLQAETQDVELKVENGADRKSI